MFSAALSLLLSCPFLMLRLSGNSGSFPKPLTAREEEQYLKEFADGSLEARNILIERNLRLVAHIMKKYYTQADDQDDLISIGTIGLIKGISTYKANKGVRLATYASRCIENEILMYFRSTKKMAWDVSLSDSIDTDKEGNSLSLLDVISTEEDMLDEISNRETCRQLRQFVQSCLTQREAQVITLRYGLFQGQVKTQREIAELCGISRSYVSRIEKKALEKLREAFQQQDRESEAAAAKPHR